MDEVGGFSCNFNISKGPYENSNEAGGAYIELNMLKEPFPFVEADPRNRNRNTVTSVVHHASASSMESTESTFIGDLQVGRWPELTQGLRSGDGGFNMALMEVRGDRDCLPALIEGGIQVGASSSSPILVLSGLETNLRKNPCADQGYGLLEKNLPSLWGFDWGGDDVGGSQLSSKIVCLSRLGAQ